MPSNSWCSELSRCVPSHLSMIVISRSGEIITSHQGILVLDAPSSCVQIIPFLQCLYDATLEALESHSVPKFTNLLVSSTKKTRCKRESCGRWHFPDEARRWSSCATGRNLARSTSGGIGGISAGHRKRCARRIFVADVDGFKSGQEDRASCSSRSKGRTHRVRRSLRRVFGLDCGSKVGMSAVAQSRNVHGTARVSIVTMSDVLNADQRHALGGQPQQAELNWISNRRPQRDASAAW